MSSLSSVLRFLARWQFSILAFLTIWLLYGLTLNASNLIEFNLQQMGVEAVVERGVFYVDGSPTPELAPGGDVFEWGDHLYAAKQPGQFMAGALVYFFIYRLGLSYLSNFLLTSALVTWFTSGLITALATVVIFHIARSFARAGSTLWALGAAATFALATTAFPYAGVAHHDAIAAGYLVIAFGCVVHLALKVSRRDVWLAGLAGVLLGLTITTSILPALMVVVVGIYFLVLRRWTLLPVFAVGALLGLLPLLVYDAVNFGNPLLLPNIAGDFSDTFFELDAENFVSKVEFYARQLTLYAPLVWLGLLGLFFLPRAFRREQLVMLGVIGVLVAYVFNIDTVGDCQFGPRYLLPAMPYLALGLVGFSYLAVKNLRRGAIAALAVVGLVSLAINTTGALYGAMYCNLKIYALDPYLAAAAQGQFRDLPLLPYLLPWFALVIALWVILLQPAPDITAEPLAKEGTHSPNGAAPTTRPWYFLFIAVVLSPHSLIIITLLTASFLRFYRLWELPPGLWLDEAFYGLDALRVLRTGQLSAFFAQNGGREPLFIYLQSGALALLGIQAWALRIVPAMVGVLTVALMYPLGRTLFSDTPRARAIALTTAACMAVVYWHVSFSRLGFRAILLPAASVVTIYLFWRGWQARSTRVLAFSGIALGITFYTYLSARLLPFVLLGFAAVVLLLYYLDARKTANGALSKLLYPPSFIVRGLAIVFATAALVALPLGLYFYQHPDDFIGRTSAVSLTPENIALSGLPPDTPPEEIVRNNLINVARIVIDYGDNNVRHNLPGRAALDPLMALGFFVGLVAGILSLRRSPVYALLFLWILLMVAPSVLSIEAPHFLRMLGALPPIILLVADGLTRAWSRLTPRYSWSSLIVLVLLFCGTLTFRDYFVTWANLPTLNTYGFDTNHAGLGGERLKTLSREADILVPTRVYGNPAMQFALEQEFNRVENWDPRIPLNRPLVIATTEGAADKQWVLLHRDLDGTGRVFFIHTMSDVSGLRAGVTQPILGRKGERLGGIIPLKEEAKALIRPPVPSRPADVPFANGLKFVGFDVNPPALAPDQTVELALYWQPQVDLDRDHNIFVHVIDKDGNTVGQWDGQPMFGFYTTGLWRRDAIITDLYPLHIPPDAAPGSYKFAVGWVGADGERVSILDAQGNEISDQEVFGRLEIAP